MCVKDTGTKYQLWISDFNIDGTFTRVHPFIISHTKTMTRTREDGKEEVFSACIKPDDARYLGGNKNSSVNAIKLQGRPRTGINYDKANEFCANRGDWITMIDYLEYCALQALCYIEYANKYGINKHDKNRQYENEDLVDKLFNLKYKTSKYSLYKIYEPKERIIYRLPYYPDRIAHHAIMNVVKDIWTKSFIHNTYSCIEGRGIHLCASNLKRDLRKYPNKTTYCLKLDIKKFYPSIPHDGLKKCIRKKIKDKYFLMILDEIIDSTDNLEWQKN